LVAAIAKGEKIVIEEQRGQARANPVVAQEKPYRVKSRQKLDAPLECHIIRSAHDNVDVPMLSWW